MEDGYETTADYPRELMDLVLEMARELADEPAPGTYDLAWCAGCLRVLMGQQSRGVQSVGGIVWRCSTCDEPWARLRRLYPCDACRLSLLVDAVAGVERYGDWASCDRCPTSPAAGYETGSS